MRRIPLQLVLIAVLFLTACGDTVIQTLRATIAGSAPLRNSLVAERVISQELSDKLGTDFEDAADCADTLNQDFKAIPADAADKRARKLSAGVKAGRCWKVILTRQNFAQHARLERIANIIDGAFSAVIVFYSEPGEMKASVAGATSAARDEKELERQLQKQIDELKQAMKP